MHNNELTQRISTHQDIIAKLNRLSPEVEAYQMRISQFILKNPGLAGLPYSGCEILMKEKDPHVCYKAIKVIREELRTRRDPETPGYRFKYRVITDSRVMKILLECRPKTENNKLPTKTKTTPIDVVCPYCNREIRYIPEKRGEVVAFRGTVITDDVVEHLAEKCDVSRSFLINELLNIEHKFSYALKE